MKHASEQHEHRFTRSGEVLNFLELVLSPIHYSETPGPRIENTGPSIYAYAVLHGDDRICAACRVHVRTCGCGGQG